jgi:PKD repeat protein
MTYEWDLGNGTTSQEQDPVVTFDEPGSYTITLETTILGYVLDAVNVSGVNGNWCGDVEEAFCNCGTPIIGTCPDLFFVLSNDNGPVFTSGTIDGVTSASWTGLDLALQDPPYSITVWDEDLVSQNDNLGTYDIVLSPGATNAFSVAGTNGTLTIDLVALQTFIDSAVVDVFELPTVSISTTPNGGICATETTLVDYTWFLDGDTLPDASGPCIVPAGAGQYWVVGTNGFGCSAQSDTVVVCPQLTIVQAGAVLSVPAGFNDYVWSFGGTALPGGDGPSLTAGPDGVYTVVVQADNGCEVTATYTYSTVGIEELEAAGGGLLVYPVPNDGVFTVEAAGLAGTTAGLRITDMSGRTVYERQEAVALGRLRSAVLLDVVPGPYVVQVWDQTRSFTQRIVVH